MLDQSAAKGESIAGLSGSEALRARGHEIARRLSGQNLVAGRLIAAVSGADFPVIDPATGQVIAAAARSGPEDIDAAVTQAFQASSGWSALPPRERGGYLTRCADLLALHQDDLVAILTLETGKAVRPECKPEAGLIVDVLRFFSGLGSEIKGETVPIDDESLTYTLHEPIGVVGAIIPWNVPLMLLGMKLGPALLAGNCVVVKTSEEAPFAALEVCRLMNEILPPGVLNVVSGLGAEAGDPLVRDPRVGKVTFTGSVETGQKIAAAAAPKLIPLTLELGGKSPMIVFPDIELDRAVEGTIFGMRFSRQGQSCTSTSRVYLHDEIFGDFVAAMTAGLEKLKIGDPFDEETDIGAVISKAQLDKIESYNAIAMASPEAKVTRCGKLPDDDRLSGGFWTRPTLITGIDEHSPVAREEVFGPICCLFGWNDLDSVVARANDSDYGLAACIWTNGLKEGLSLAHRLEAGIVQVNQIKTMRPGVSYGGHKLSGIGEEATLESLIQHFTKKKTIAVNLR